MTLTNIFCGQIAEFYFAEKSDKYRNHWALKG
jgi:hypothetical protein